MVLIALGLFALSLLLAIAEMIEEWKAGTRDWYLPHTGRYALIFGTILVWALILH